MSVSNSLTHCFKIFFFMSLWSSVCAFPAVFLWSTALIQLVFLWISLNFYHFSRLLFWQQTTHGDHAFFFLSVEVAGFCLQWFIFISDICALGVTSPRTWQRHSYHGARKTCTCLAGFDVFCMFLCFLRNTRTQSVVYVNVCVCEVQRPLLTAHLQLWLFPSREIRFPFSQAAYWIRLSNAGVVPAEQATQALKTTPGCLLILL